jgi:hypothetical protein
VYLAAIFIEDRDVLVEDLVFLGKIDEKQIQSEARDRNNGKKEGFGFPGEQIRNKKT